VAQEVYTNDGLGTVTSGGTGAPASGTTETWTVSITRAFPSPGSGQVFRVYDTATGVTLEKMIVPAGNSGTVGSQTWANVVRGAEGTTPVAHASGFTIQQVLTAGTFSVLADQTSPQTLANKTLQATAEVAAVLGTISGSSLSIDLTAGNVQTVTLGASPTVSFINVPSGAVSLTVYVTQASGGSGFPYNVTWPGSVTWLGGAAPAVNTAASSVSVFGFTTPDGGTHWFGWEITQAPSLPLSVSNGGTASSTRVWEQYVTIPAVVTASASPYTLNPGTFAPFDTTGGPITVNIPGGPDGSILGAKVDAGTNPVTITTLSGDRADSGCTVTSGSKTVLDAAAQTSGVGGTDVGKKIRGPGIPPGTTISSVVAGVSYQISQFATANSPGGGVTLAVGGSTLAFDAVGSTPFTYTVNPGDPPFIAKYAAASTTWYITSPPATTSGFTNPMAGTGDLIYGGSSGVATKLAADTSNTRKFLREQSSGGTPAAPVWDTIQPGDLPGTGGWRTTDYGFQAWAYDPALCTNSISVSASNGFITLIGMQLGQAASITQLWVMVTTAATSITTASMGLYSSAGTRLATASAATALATTTPTAVTISPTSAGPGLVWLAVVYTGTGTALSIGRLATNSSNFGLANTATRFGQYQVSAPYTSLPSSITPSSITATGSAAYWGAIG